MPWPGRGKSYPQGGFLLPLPCGRVAGTSSRRSGNGKGRHLLPPAFSFALNSPPFDPIHGPDRSRRPPVAALERACLRAVVAQLVRAPDCGSGGRWFDPSQPYHRRAIESCAPGYASLSASMKSLLDVMGWASQGAGGYMRCHGHVLSGSVASAARRARVRAGPIGRVLRRFAGPVLGEP